MTETTMPQTLAWHFVGATLRDGSPVPADGVVLKYTGKIKLCETGLHASVRLIDALQYAPGDMICRVRCSGRIEHGDDKLVCSEREILWRIDGEQLLREFARRCALDVAHLWNAPEVVLTFLRTGDEKPRAAASNAALNAAWSAWAAAMDAAAADARDSRAATAAASNAAWAAMDDLLTRIVEQAHERIA